jgi:single-stranded DNA-binding protein
VKLGYPPSGKPEVTFTLVLERPVTEKTDTVFVPVQVCRADSEAFAETLEPGDVVRVEGKL